MAHYSDGEGAQTIEEAMSRPSPGMTRLLIPDVLRGVAIIAMVVAHAAPFVPDVPWAVKIVTGNLSDLASPLFALVMGMSAELVWRRGGRRSVTILQQCVRGLFLTMLGAWMATWGSWVDVILGYLGVVVILGVPILLARTPIVVAMTAVLLLISQPLLVVARTWTWVYTAPVPVGDLMNWLLLGPHYRVINLLPSFLIGALLIRHGLRRDALLSGIAIAAPLAYLVWLVAERMSGANAPSGDYLDTLKDFGLVGIVYVIIVLAATARRSGAKSFWHPVFVPLIACGQVALSLYLLHVGLIALWAQNFGRPTENFWPGWLVIVPGMILVGWLWWRFVGTGPVEWLMGWLTGRRKPLLRAR